MSSSITTSPWVRGNGDRRRRPVDISRRDFGWSRMRAARGAGETLSLAPCDGGWQLVSETGRVTFSAVGRDAHTRCLRRAYESGALCVR